MFKDSLEYNGKKVEYEIEKKRVKNINLCVRRDKTVHLSIPNKMTLEDARKFMYSRREWILKQLEYYDARKYIKEDAESLYLHGKALKIVHICDNKNYILINEKFEIHLTKNHIEDEDYIKKLCDKWKKEYAFEFMRELATKYHKKMKAYGISFPEIFVRDMKSRWGSCIPSKNKVTFNIRLIKVPIECAEYVVVHELAHLKHPNHSDLFYDFVARFVPNWKELKEILDKKYTVV